MCSTTIQTAADDITDILESIAEGLKDCPFPVLVTEGPKCYRAALSFLEKAQVRALFMNRAVDLGPEAAQSLSEIFRMLADEDKARKLDNDRILARSRKEAVPFLDTDKNGVPVCSLNNFLTIMNTDPNYRDYRYNTLKNAGEILERDLDKVTARPLQDTDLFASELYIQETYHIYNSEIHAKAMALMLHGREYNPVLQLLEELPPWDGVPRLEGFLNRWMGAEDSLYVREVSRLIFAGGIHRIYEPGCKFDCCAVLIGLRQGEGKSTIIRWLSMKDEFFSEVTIMDGKEGIEALEGAWICEMSEMTAVSRAKDLDAVKAYITRQNDTYRKPYSRTTSVLPRKCIFIGTTNNARFLSDPTGNRRFFPVEVHTSGYDLYDRESECREYIRLCWAEAKHRYHAGELSTQPDRNLLDSFLEEQKNATMDDWREGAIRAYLECKAVGEKVCVRQLQREALFFGSDIPRDPSWKEAREIGQIMDRIEGWVRLKKSCYIAPEYRIQRGWEKI